jgi:translation initiation factor 5A
MVLKFISATEAKVGMNIMVDGKACTVKKMDVSKTGKHGHAKCRIEAVGIIDGNKKVFVIPGHDKLDVPSVEKRKAQILSKLDGKVSLMDLESFETLEVPVPENEIFNELEEGSNCEYWDVEGEKIVKRKL